jgi:SAM-dependent methyltransferase
MDRSLLTRLFGFPATLVHGDPLVLDRWLWLKSRLPRTRNGERVIDVGCGTGAFSIGAARRGYDTLGVSWDERNQRVAAERAKICEASSAKFEVLDVRKLHERADFVGAFDVAINFENIEHVLDDRKLMRDVAACLKPGGRLLLTTPYLLYRSITDSDQGPFSKTEDGWHVRRGYSKAMLTELCDDAGLVVEEFSFCSGLLSQKLNTVQRYATKIHPLLGWAAILPFRPFPPLLDGIVGSATHWPAYSICLDAYKPRFTAPLSAEEQKGLGANSLPPGQQGRPEAELS